MSHLSKTPFIIWKLCDGKPGHENQSQGLIDALHRKTPCESYEININQSSSALLGIVSGHWQPGESLPKPDLIIGAGHRTHLPMLSAKRCYGGKTIVLMKPTIPVKFFDLAIIPEHDNYHGQGSVLVSKGALNTIQATGSHDTYKSLILIGGPSKHYEWHEIELLEQIKLLLSHHQSQQFTLTTSRRTPTSFVDMLKQVQYPNLTVVPYEETSSGWVAKQLAESGSAWISPDSVSMIYEALTAQIVVGLFNMTPHKANRINRAVDKLVEQKLVHLFSDKPEVTSQHQTEGLREADKCADWIIKNWLT